MQRVGFKRNANASDDLNITENDMAQFAAEDMD